MNNVRLISLETPEEKRNANRKKSIELMTGEDDDADADQTLDNALSDGGSAGSEDGEDKEEVLL